MKKSLKRARMLALAAIGACALMAASASAASAATAWWTNPGAVSASGTLTLKQNGANEKTCTMFGGSGGEAGNVEFFGVKTGGLTINSAGVAELLEFSCTGSSLLQMGFKGALASYESGFWITDEPRSLVTSPYGSYTPTASLKLAWTNGTEGKQSTISFNNTKIGSNGGGSITATGTFTIKRTNGEVPTLTH